MDQRIDRNCKQDIQGHTVNSDAGTYTLSHLYDALFSATATSCGEISELEVNSTKNINNKEEKLDLDLIVLKMCDNQLISLFKLFPV